MTGTAPRCARVVLLCLLGFPVEVWAQATGGELPARLSATSRARITVVLDSAVALGLPVAPLVAKAQEGILKGADDARIEAAVRRLWHDLQDARETLGHDASPEVLVAAAGALRAGLRAPQLLALARESGADRPAVLSRALVVAADLVGRGVATELATTQVESLLARRASGADLESLRRSVERDIEAGMGPGDALASRARDLSQRLDARHPGPGAPAH
jgi:hypothetical protein